MLTIAIFEEILKVDRIVYDAFLKAWRLGDGHKSGVTSVVIVVVVVFGEDLLMYRYRYRYLVKWEKCWAC